MTFVVQLSQLVSPFRERILSACVLATAACAASLAVPFRIQHLVDSTVRGAETADLIFIGAGLLCLVTLQAIASLASVMLMGHVSLQIARALRHRAYARLQRARISYFDRTPVGAIIARLMDDVLAVQNLVSSQSLTLLTDLATTGAVLVCILRNLHVFLALAALIPVYVVSFRYFARHIRSRSLEVRSQLDAIFGQLKQKFDGALVVKAHACEEDEITRFSAQIAAAHETRLRLERMNSAFSSVNLLLSGVGSSLVFAVAAWEASWGRMTPGEVVLMASMAVLVFAPVARLADLASVYEQARASMNRLNEIIDQAPAIPDLARPLPLLSATGLVEFKEVGFHYEEGQPVLADISFRIEPGMKVAIVGPTGSGKTTLMNLLMRFYDPTSGAIRLDGEALDRLAVGDLRKQIGIVAQEPVIFRQSLADNIRYGAGNVSQTVVEAAARAALVDEIAAGLPNGYQTLIGEGGYKLSQGERQRIAIARALCKNPALVVLDEATSSLDAPSEALIQAALANLLRGRTAFIIAHRLATVADADLIVVLDQGRVVQVGKHTDLLAQPDGLYGQLLRGQFGDAPTAA